MVELHTLGTVRVAKPDGSQAEGLVAQPKRLALLAYLAVARPRGAHRRDALLGMFWPELDQARARHALSQALHFLRRELGADVFVTQNAEEVALSSDHLRCDATQFEAKADQKDLEGALALYHGDFLSGFFLSDAPEFEHWAETARSRLRARAVEAAHTHAERMGAEGKKREAARWALHAASLDPLNERAIRRLMRACDQTGDRSGALRAYMEFARRLKAELDAEPAPETRALADEIRAREEPSALSSGELPPGAAERGVVELRASTPDSRVGWLRSGLRRLLRQLGLK
jgi:DNA-binding SARP family transcriptional activator